jgi:hypothetical protein
MRSEVSRAPTQDAVQGQLLAQRWGLVLRALNVVAAQLGFRCCLALLLAEECLKPLQLLAPLFCFLEHHCLDAVVWSPPPVGLALILPTFPGCLEAGVGALSFEIASAAYKSAAHS